MREGMSENARVEILEGADIGGTHAETAWVDMTEFQRVYAKVILGAWDAGDDLDECRLEQATSAAGAGAKDLTTDASGGNYDTDTPIDADGNTVVLEARVEDLDTEGGFKFVRLYVAEGGNTGPDIINGVLIAYGATYKRQHLEAAPVTGEVKYARPS